MNNFFFHLLYIICAFCFGIISCRYTILSLSNFLTSQRSAKSMAKIISASLCFLQLALSWLILPYFFYLRSLPALAAYFASLIFFLLLSYKRSK